MRRFLLACIFLVAANSESLAGEATYASYSPAVYAITGLFIVDIGSALGNGIALSRGEPNRLNGYFGLVSGIISLGLVAVTFAIEDDEDLRNGFGLIMGTAGTASLVLGALNIRGSRKIDQMEKTGSSGVSVRPVLSVGTDRRCRIGINMNVAF